MSDRFTPAFAEHAPGNLEWLASPPGAGFGASTGFRSDPRYAGAAEPEAEREPEVEPQDPLAQAWAEGYAAGSEHARGEAARSAEAEAAARDALELSFGRLERELAEQLRQQLRETVAALCEASLAPLALDEAALLRRIDRAVAMFARADDERVIHLHPDDIKLVSAQFAQDWQIVPDTALTRGALRIETTSGGVEDGPAQWRHAIAEALRQC